MHPDLEALLALQDNDAEIAAIEERLEKIRAQLGTLDHERLAIEEAIRRARDTAEGEDRRRRELLSKVDEHKALQQRNLAVLDAVRKEREASAALAQIDLTRRVLAQEESDVHALSARITDLRQAAELHELELAEVDARQQAERSELAAAQGELERSLAEARARRQESAQRVSRSLLQKYERIRGREKSNALYALRGTACGRCNTAIPLQRRNVMAAGRSIEVCEGCGVLLYAAV